MVSEMRVNVQSAVKRAFQIAPECSSITELKKRLKAEGFEQLELHIGGLGTQRQLRTLFKNIRENG